MNAYIQINNQKKLFDLFNPDQESFSIKGIAASLSKICRFGGHTPSFYSVAEHSILCLRFAEATEQSNGIKRMALLHDSAEAFIGDLVTPVKMFCPEVKDMERLILKGICERFAIPDPCLTIKYFDRLALYIEALEFFGITEWNYPPKSIIEDFDHKTIESIQGAAGSLIHYFTPERAEDEFILAAQRLGL